MDGQAADIQTHYNEHGVRSCDRTIRTNAPWCFTRIRFGVREAYFCEATMLISPQIRPWYRSPGEYGMKDEGFRP